MTALINELNSKKKLSRAQWIELFSAYDDESVRYAADLARNTSLGIFGRDIYFRGIIEFTNFCKNDCLYCGLRRSALGTERYRLSAEQIMECCREGYSLGCRTFVLQGGRTLITRTRGLRPGPEIKYTFPDTAVTLSLGERSRQSYERLFQSGQTAIFSAMKRPRKNTMKSCIRSPCPLKNAWPVCKISGTSAIRPAAA
jgi:biotin synthase